MKKEKKLVDMIDISEDVKEWNKREVAGKIKAFYKVFDKVEVDFFTHSQAQRNVTDVLHRMPYDTLVSALQGFKWDFKIYTGINEGYQDKMIVFRVHCDGEMMLSVGD